jgi:general stress protein 26
VSKSWGETVKGAASNWIAIQIGKCTTMDEHRDAKENIKKLRELIQDIKFAMLTTVEEDGTLRSRPMATQATEFDGDLWFFTNATAPKVDEVQRDQHVNVSYANPEAQKYVSISGRAQLVRDRHKIEELWNPLYKAWFPKGLDDPDLALLQVSVEQAEYWDSPSSPLVRLVGFVKALTTGKPYSGGENQKIDADSVEKAVGARET